jgi:arginase family enzyme
MPVPLVGANLGEYNPQRDHRGVTAMLAVKLLNETLAQMPG